MPAPKHSPIHTNSRAPSPLSAQEKVRGSIGEGEGAQRSATTCETVVVDEMERGAAQPPAPISAIKQMTIALAKAAIALEIPSIGSDA